MIEITGEQARALTDLIRAMRLDWDRPDIIEGLRQLADRDEGDYWQLCVAAVKAAAHPKTKQATSIADPYFWGQAWLDTWVPSRSISLGHLEALAKQGDYERGAAEARRLLYEKRNHPPRADEVQEGDAT